MKNNIRKTNIYLPGLHGLRFIAALGVIVTHVELFKGRWNLPNLYNINFIKDLGTIGVDFFFVLSGFLITFLLFKEHKKNNSISIKKFYIRRILRIWPLYYFIILIVFFILPLMNFPSLPGLDINDNFFERFTLFMLFLPNVSKAFFEFVPYGGVLWSVGVEEQFYLLWPLIIAFSVKTFRSIIAVMLFFIGIKVLAILPLYEDFYYIHGIRNLLAMMRIELMAIGGIGAWLLFHQKKHILKLIYSKWVQLVSFCAILLIIFFLPEFLNNAKHILLAAFFLIIILNVSSNPDTFLKLENKPLRFLGNISFGLYMYHMIVAGGLIYVLKGINLNLITFNLILYSSTILITVGISYLSFRFLESPFLKYKNKYATVPSGLALTLEKPKKQISKIYQLSFGRERKN